MSRATVSSSYMSNYDDIHYDDMRHYPPYGYSSKMGYPKRKMDFPNSGEPRYRHDCHSDGYDVCSDDNVNPFPLHSARANYPEKHDRYRRGPTGMRHATSHAYAQGHPHGYHNKHGHSQAIVQGSGHSRRRFPPSSHRHWDDDYENDHYQNSRSSHQRQPHGHNNLHTSEHNRHQNNYRYNKYERERHMYPQQRRTNYERPRNAQPWHWRDQYNHNSSNNNNNSRQHHNNNNNNTNNWHHIKVSPRQHLSETVSQQNRPTIGSVKPAPPPINYHDGLPNPGNVEYIDLNTPRWLIDNTNVYTRENFVSTPREDLTRRDEEDSCGGDSEKIQTSYSHEKVTVSPLRLDRLPTSSPTDGMPQSATETKSAEADGEDQDNLSSLPALTSQRSSSVIASNIAHTVLDSPTTASTARSSLYAIHQMIDYSYTSCKVDTLNLQEELAVRRSALRAVRQYLTKLTDSERKGLNVFTLIQPAVSMTGDEKPGHSNSICVNEGGGGEQSLFSTRSSRTMEDLSGRRQLSHDFYNDIITNKEENWSISVLGKLSFKFICACGSEMTVIRSAPENGRMTTWNVGPSLKAHLNGNNITYLGNKTKLDNAHAQWLAKKLEGDDDKDDEDNDDDDNDDDDKDDDDKDDEDKANEDKDDEEKYDEDKDDEEQKEEEQKEEEQKVEEQKVEEPIVEEQIVEEQIVEEQKVEEQKIEEQKVEEQKIEEPKVEEHKVELEVDAQKVQMVNVEDKQVKAKQAKEKEGQEEEGKEEVEREGEKNDEEEKDVIQVEEEATGILSS